MKNKTFYNIQYTLDLGIIGYSSWMLKRLDTKESVAEFIKNESHIKQLIIKFCEPIDTKTKISKQEESDNTQYLFIWPEGCWSYKDAKLSKQQYKRILKSYPDTVFYRATKMNKEDFI